MERIVSFDLRKFLAKKNLTLEELERRQIENVERLERLINKLNGPNRLKMKEEDKAFIFSFLNSNLILYDRYQGDWIQKRDILSNPILENYKFLYLFISCDYWKDVNDRLKHVKPNTSELPYSIPTIFFSDKENIEFIEKIFQNWKSKITNRNFSTEFEERLCSVASKAIREEKLAAKITGSGAFLMKLFEKRLFLFYT